MIAIDMKVRVKGYVEPGIVKGYHYNNYIVIWDNPPTALPKFQQAHENKALLVYEDACIPYHDNVDVRAEIIDFIAWLYNSYGMVIAEGVDRDFRPITQHAETITQAFLSTRKGA